jgi:competence protein ComEC
MAMHREAGSGNASEAIASAPADAASQAPTLRSMQRLQVPALALSSPLAVVLLLLGIAAAMAQAELLPLTALWLMLGGSLAIGWRLPASRWLLIPLFGLAWASLHGHWAMDARLDPALEGSDVVLTGRIEGLPTAAVRRIGFGFRVESADAAAAELVGQRLRLSWYGNDPPAIEPGARWSLTVRLKRPRGVQNPGGFDYERHALQERIAATGHVREAADNQLLAPAAGVDALRARLSDQIGQLVESPARRFLQGLAVGDRRALDGNDWEVLRATGLSHLLAISGLHIGLVAGFGALLARGLYWLWPALGLRLPRPQGAAMVALVFAIGYAALAGFGLPTQRALLMIATVLVAVLARRSIRPLQGLALAALVLMLVDPLAVLGAGFWLSFLGVMWLLLCLHERGGLGAAARGLLRAQVAMSLGLLPLTVWFFGQASLAGALANLVAVPWVSFTVVPPTLLGAALSSWAPTPAAWLLGFAAGSMQLLWLAASWLAALPWAQVFLPEASVASAALALLGMGWLLMPRPLPGKPFALLLLLPLLWPAQQRLQPGEWELRLLDVGQGLAMLLRTQEHAMLYDAGPAFAGGLDMGEAAVLPALRALGVRRLDVIVLSHHHDDHVGGAGALQRAYPQARVLAGEPSRSGALACTEADGWEWSGVRFTMLHPPEHFPELGNESSCVLRVDGAGAAALLTGDIGEVIETRLLRAASTQLAAQVLQVPHHGSHSSSSTAFVAAVAPELGLIGVGHRNRFGHPREVVVDRYRARGTALLDSASDGAVSVRATAGGSLLVERRRASHRRFWHEP